MKNIFLALTICSFTILTNYASAQPGDDSNARNKSNEKKTEDLKVETRSPKDGGGSKLVSHRGQLMVGTEDDSLNLRVVTVTPCNDAFEKLKNEEYCFDGQTVRKILKVKHNKIKTGDVENSKDEKTAFIKWAEKRASEKPAPKVVLKADCPNQPEKQVDVAMPEVKTSGGAPEKGFGHVWDLHPGKGKKASHIIVRVPDQLPNECVATGEDEVDAYISLEKQINASKGGMVSSNCSKCTLNTVYYRDETNRWAAFSAEKLKETRRGAAARIEVQNTTCPKCGKSANTESTTGTSTNTATGATIAH